MAAIRNLVTGKQLMIVLLKLFDFCLKVKANRQQLIRVEMNSITIMLGALNLVRHSRLDLTHTAARKYVSGYPELI